MREWGRSLGGALGHRSEGHKTASELVEESRLANNRAWKGARKDRKGKKERRPPEV